MNVILLVIVAIHVVSADFEVKSQSNLTLELMTKLSAKNGNDRNVVFSPSSIFYGVGLLYSGMSGETKEAVRKAMHFPEDDTKFKSAMEVSDSSSKDEFFVLRFPFKTFTKVDNNTSPLFVANMISFSKGVGVRSSFAKEVKQVFHASPYNQDFSDPESARKSINIWVARRTNKKIRQIMPPGNDFQSFTNRHFLHFVRLGSVKKTTNVVLVNALYFKSEWEESFDAPIKGKFNDGNGKEIEADMLTGEKLVGTEDIDGHTVVAIPFKDQGFRMVIVLPKQGSSKLLSHCNLQHQHSSIFLGPDDVLESMTDDSKLMKSVLEADKLKNETVLLSMPK